MNSRIIQSAELFVLFFVMIVFVASCGKPDTLFQQVSSGRSGIFFTNRITENDSVNQLDNENVYNGGGAGTGDFNNDGLPDIYLTGNQVESKLYINRGNFRFRDITQQANVIGDGKWCRGVAVIDINNDGWDDIYVSATLKKKAEERRNLLYINNGLNKNKIPTFTEKASEYGLDDESHTTQANFFDYDNDGDLDVYLVVNEIHPRISPYLFRPVLKNGSNPSTGKLLRNDWNASLQHPVFTDVSAEAGIQKEGYSHSAIITDINRDGWPDIYVGNDFVTNDLLWINNQDGTFTDELNKYFKHTSANSMGNDIGDINNDGLMDVISLDMNPEDNYRKKMMLPPLSYQNYQHTELFGYNYQYVRNTLQLNQGSVNCEDSLQRPVFSEIGYYAGITATDWSWAPLLTDFDNDGFRDMIICNGFPKDVTDHDFGMFRAKAFYTATKAELLTQVPEVKIHNYAFRNNADLTFTDVSDEWGMSMPTFSNGAAYADFDLDGDLDIIINNINDEASLYKNNSRELDAGNSHFLRVNLKGDKHNLQGFGAWIEIYYDHDKKQAWESNPYRGYISTIEDIAHFGLGKVTSVDSVIIKWQNGRVQTFRDVPADQVLAANIEEAGKESKVTADLNHANPVFSDITKSVGISYVHTEADFADFNIQKLLPHKYSEYGPALAAGDIDGNGLDDIITGGSYGNSSQLFLQQTDGNFIQKPLLKEKVAGNKNHDDAGILVFDADGDTDSDLYIAAGGYESEGKAGAYKDHLYINDGKGNFREAAGAVPENFTSKSCVRAADFDQDGDNDLFIAGRVDPWYYPRPVSSYILRNDSENGTVKFTDVTEKCAPALINIGLISDGLFTDFNNDGWTDLVLAGEWMPLTFLKNEDGIFKDVTSSTGINDKTGWWSSVAAGDFDNDGDTDYIAGNLGLNTFYKANMECPASVYAADFDNNGSYDAFPSIYLPADQQDKSVAPFPVHGRDDAVKQMISMRSRFQNYKSFAACGIEQLFSDEQLKKALVLRATYFESSYCRNDGNGRFSLFPLPAQAQFSTLNGMIVDDFDGDQNLDVVINGNDYGTEVTVGRYDALNGIMLKGDGSGNFIPLSAGESGIFIPGNGKALAGLKGKDGSYLLAASQNRGPLKLFELNRKRELLQVLPNARAAELMLANGKNRKQELYYGSSFYSQSARYLPAGDEVKGITVYDNAGKPVKVK